MLRNLAVPVWPFSMGNNCIWYSLSLSRQESVLVDEKCSLIQKSFVLQIEDR